MSKPILLVLLLGAVVYALALVFTRRPAPDPVRATGLGRRFRLAVHLCHTFLLGLLFTGSGQAADDPGPTPVPMCYSDVIEERDAEDPAVRGDWYATLQVMWSLLDRNLGERFTKRLDAAVEDGRLEADAAAVLALAYRELSYHKQRSAEATTCYKMTPIGTALMRSRSQIMAQLTLLRDAVQAGTIEDETVTRVEATLTRELELLGRLDALPGPEESNWDEVREQLEALQQDYADEAFEPSTASTTAAGWIASLETGGPLPEDD